VVDKAVNFILHSERFDGQVSFNPRLALTGSYAQKKGGRDYYAQGFLRKLTTSEMVHLVDQYKEEHELNQHIKSLLPSRRN